MEYTTAVDIGKRKRRQGGINEDSVAVTVTDEGHRDTNRRSGVFVLADGAGGARAGDVASYVTTVEVTRRLSDRLWTERRLSKVADFMDASREEFMADAVSASLSSVTDQMVETWISDAIAAAHTRLLEVIDDLGVQDGYSTVVAAVAIDGRLHYGWIGDSRAYIINVAQDREDDQRVSRLTKDHSEVERLVNQGAIDEVEAHVHRRGNMVTRALGGTRGEDPARSSVSADTGTVPLFGDDVVLLTSDGLIDAYTGAPELHEAYQEAENPDSVAERILEKSVTDDEIGEVVLDAPSLEAAADRFVELSNERGGKDNVSIILFRDDSLPYAPEGALPVRAYDPDVEEILARETVKQRSDDQRNAPNARNDSSHDVTDADADADG